MAHAIQIGPRRFYEPARDLAYTTPLKSPIDRVFETASDDDRQAAAHLTWWTSPHALIYRTGCRIFHENTGLVSRWGLVPTAQGRWLISLEVWADDKTTLSSWTTIPRHLSPSLHASQLDGRAVECMRRAA